MRSSAPEARELFFREPRRTEYEKGVFKLQDDTQTADDMERAVMKLRDCSLYDVCSSVADLSDQN